MRQIVKKKGTKNKREEGNTIKLRRTNNLGESKETSDKKACGGHFRENSKDQK